MKIRSTKRELIVSIVSLTICASMLVGTTTAWFTDTIKTGPNVIQAGRLNIVAKWDNSDTVQLSLQNDENSSGSKTIVVENNGTLTADVNLVFNDIPEGIDNSLEFTLITESNEIRSIESTTLEELQKVTLTLEPGESGNFTLGYSMIPNEGKVGTEEDFSLNISVLANQSGIQTTTPEINVVDEQSFKEALQNVENGGTVFVNDDIKLTNDITIDKSVTIEGIGDPVISGKSITVKGKEVNITGIQFTSPTNENDNASSIYVQDITEKLVIDSCKFTNTQYDSIQIGATDGNEIVIKNCEFGKGMGEGDHVDGAKNAYINIESIGANLGNIKVKIQGNTFYTDGLEHRKSPTEWIVTGKVIDIKGVKFENIEVGSNIQVGQNIFIGDAIRIEYENTVLDKENYRVGLANFIKATDRLYKISELIK